MKRIAILVAGVAILVSGCAKNPDAIPPASMSSMAYDRLTCQEAVLERNRVVTDLASLSSQQRNAVAGDAVGVLLIGVPVSSLTGGNKEGLIAARKGEQQALDARLISCGV